MGFRADDDLTEHRFGRLTVESYAGRYQPNGRTSGHAWNAICDCGTFGTYSARNLVAGASTSCGCWRRERMAMVSRGETPPRHAERYLSIHSDLRHDLGPASDRACVDCGQPAVHWSYNENCPDEQIAGSPWCSHVEHYAPRCRKCHSTHDATAKAQRRAGVSA